MTNRLDLIVLAVLIALALMGVLALALTGHPIPDVFGYVIAACVGAVTGATMPKRGQP